jgi:transposase
MSKYYDDEFKKRIVRLRLEEGRTVKSICEEYNVSKSAINT